MLTIDLKGVKHPTDSGSSKQLKSNLIFEIICSHFEAAVAKIFKS